MFKAFQSRYWNFNQWPNCQRSIWSYIPPLDLSLYSSYNVARVHQNKSYAVISNAGEQLWTSDPTLSYVYKVNPRQLYSMVAKRDANPMILKPEELSGHVCNITFKLFPCLDSRTSEITLCAEVSPITHTSSEHCHYLSAIRIEAVVKDWTKTSNNCLWSPVSDQRIGFSSSVNSQPFYIFLRNLITHCSLFYYCDRHERLDVHVKCWERLTDCLDTDSGVFINSPTWLLLLGEQLCSHRRTLRSRKDIY